VTGAFRVLCDGEHDEGAEQQEEEIVEAVASEEIEHVHAPGGGEPPPVRPPL
jgi:hypothetical protein